MNPLRWGGVQWLGALSYPLYLANEPIQKVLCFLLIRLAAGNERAFTSMWIPAACWFRSVSRRCCIVTWSSPRSDGARDLARGGVGFGHGRPVPGPCREHRRSIVRPGLRRPSRRANSPVAIRSGRRDRSARKCVPAETPVRTRTVRASARETVSSGGTNRAGRQQHTQPAARFFAHQRGPRALVVGDQRTQGQTARDIEREARIVPSIQG